MSRKWSFAECRNYLKKSDGVLTDWRYSVQIKVLMVNGSFKKSTKITANINLLQAAVIKHDIDLVKLVTSLALKKSQSNLDNLLKEVMMCDIPQKWKEWELSSNCIWITEASVIHLATFWHMESLIHFLNISEDLRYITKNYYLFV